MLVGINNSPAFAQCDLPQSPTCNPPFRLTVEDPEIIGDKAYACVLLKNTPEEICAFSFDLRIDTAVLEYPDGYDPEDNRGALAPSSTFPTWDVNPDVSGKTCVIRVGASSLNSCIPSKSSGELVCFEFDIVDPDGETLLCLEDLSDAIELWCHKCGDFP
jgi:hypothetical protein